MCVCVCVCVCVGGGEDHIKSHTTGDHNFLKIGYG